MQTRNEKGQFVEGGHRNNARAEAKAAGLKRYMGKPCLYGHSGERYTRSSDCCECRRLEFAAWTAANRKTYNEYARRYYHALPAEELARRRKRFVEKRNEWEAANPELAKAARKKFRLANMDRWRCYVRNRRARLNGISGWHDHEDVARLRAEQNDQCAHCRIDLCGAGEVDHKTPVSRGGTNWPHNLQLLCMLCNRKKHAKDPVEHARAIGLLPAAPAADGAQQEI